MLIACAVSFQAVAYPSVTSGKARGRTKPAETIVEGNGEIFDEFDTNQSGFLEKSEIKAAAGELAKEDLTREKRMYVLLLGMDSDEDGKVSLREFSDEYSDEYFGGLPRGGLSKRL